MNSLSSGPRRLPLLGPAGGGEARGKRQIADGTITVFDELVVLEPSAYGTWKISASCENAEERDALVALFEDVDGAIEDWTESVEVLCASCSLGEPHEHHGDHQAKGWRADRELELALRNERDLGRWRRLGRWWRRGVRDVTRVR
jgi:hypothetical protein